MAPLQRSESAPPYRARKPVKGWENYAQKKKKQSGTGSIRKNLVQTLETHRDRLVTLGSTHSHYRTQVALLQADVLRISGDRDKVHRDLQALQSTEKKLLSSLQDSKSQVEALQSDAALLSRVQETTYQTMRDRLVQQHSESEALKRRIQELEERDQRRLHWLQRCVGALILLAVLWMADVFLDHHQHDPQAASYCPSTAVTEAAPRAAAVAVEPSPLPKRWKRHFTHVGEHKFVF